MMLREAEDIGRREGEERGRMDGTREKAQEGSREFHYDCRFIPKLNHIDTADG